MAKATTCIYLPAAALSMVLLKSALTRSKKTRQSPAHKQTAKQIAIAGAIAIIVVWAGYGFAVGHVKESMDFSAESMPSFQHFPEPVGRIGRNLVLGPDHARPGSDERIGNSLGLEQDSSTGLSPWAYQGRRVVVFFLAGRGSKVANSFSRASGYWFVLLQKVDRGGALDPDDPAVSALAILLATMPVKYNAGVRHVLVVFPLLAIVAGYGCSYLWHLEGRRHVAGRTVLVGLLLWQCVSTARAHSDYLAYFNELAGDDPSRVMVAGCDLDCGQDLFALSRELQARHISHATLALWTSADMSKMGLPEFDIPQPCQPVKGWFAISLRALRFGDLFHHTLSC